MRPRSIKLTTSTTTGVVVVTDGSKTIQPVESVDVLSTILSLAGLKPACPGCIRSEIQSRNTTAKTSDNREFPARGLKCSKCGYRVWIVEDPAGRRYFAS